MTTECVAFVGCARYQNVSGSISSNCLNICGYAVRRITFTPHTVLHLFTASQLHNITTSQLKIVYIFLNLWMNCDEHVCIHIWKIHTNGCSHLSFSHMLTHTHTHIDRTQLIASTFSVRLHRLLLLHLLFLLRALFFILHVLPQIWMYNIFDFSLLRAWYIAPRPDLRRIFFYLITTICWMGINVLFWTTWLNSRDR